MSSKNNHTIAVSLSLRFMNKSQGAFNGTLWPCTHRKTKRPAIVTCWKKVVHLWRYSDDWHHCLQQPCNNTTYIQLYYNIKKRPFGYSTIIVISKKKPLLVGKKLHSVQHTFRFEPPCMYKVTWRLGFNKLGAESCNFWTQNIRVLDNFNFVHNFSQNGEFSAPNFVFSDWNFLTIFFLTH